MGGAHARAQRTTAHDRRYMIGVLLVRTLSVVSRGCCLWGQGGGLALPAADYILRLDFEGSDIGGVGWGQVGVRSRWSSGSRLCQVRVHVRVLMGLPDEASGNRTYIDDLR